MGSLLAQSSLLQYQVDKHKANGLFELYYTIITREVNEVNEKYGSV